MSKLYLGVDGGGSKTTAAVCDCEGRVVSEFIGKSINFYSLSFDEARANFAEIIAALGCKHFDSVFIGMSALSSRADRELTSQFIEGILDAQTVYMDSDLFIALESLRSSGACAVIVSGTGSMAVGRDADGRIISKGGWGYILGDEGSGYSVSLNAVKAALRSFDGSLPQSNLLDAAISHFGVKSAVEMIDRFYNPTITRTEIASFAGCVFDAAESGDSLAAEIISNEAKLLAETAVALLNLLPQNIPVGLWGGLFEHHHSFREQFCSEIEKKCKVSEIALLRLPAVCGALIAAMKADEREITESVLSNIAKCGEVK